MSKLYFELASISKNRSSNFKGFTVSVGYLFVKGTEDISREETRETYAVGGRSYTQILPGLESEMFVQAKVQKNSWT